MNHLEQLQSFIGKKFKDSPSPFMHWLNPVVIAAEKGHLVFQYQIRKEMTNPIGTLHGGVIASIMDDVIGATMFSMNESNFFTSINLNVDFFSPAKEGDIIFAETRIIKQGRQFIHAECDIWNGDKSRLLAKGTSNLFKTDLSR